MTNELPVPKCVKCGMSPVTLVLSDVPFDGEAELQLDYLCGWGCLKLYATDKVKLTPRHGNSVARLPTLGRRKERLTSAKEKG